MCIRDRAIQADGFLFVGPSKGQGFAIFEIDHSIFAGVAPGDRRVGLIVKNDAVLVNLDERDALVPHGPFEHGAHVAGDVYKRQASVTPR